MTRLAVAPTASALRLLLVLDQRSMKWGVKRVGSHLGEIWVLIEAVRGTVKTDKHVGARSQPYTGILPEAHPVPRKHPRLVVKHPSDR